MIGKVVSRGIIFWIRERFARIYNCLVVAARCNIARTAGIANALRSLSILGSYDSVWLPLTGNSSHFRLSLHDLPALIAPVSSSSPAFRQVLDHWLLLPWPVISIGCYISLLICYSEASVEHYVSSAESLCLHHCDPSIPTHLFSVSNWERLFLHYWSLLRTSGISYASTLLHADTEGFFWALAKL